MDPWVAPMPVKERRFLVIEDEKDIAQLIALHLEDIQGNVTQVHTGSEGLEKALSETWDAIILDLRLPEMDGIDICKNIRSQGISVPIIMLTARSTELDRVLGLEIGADDYLTKPFSALELQARVKALLRRTQNLNQSDQQVTEMPSIKHGELEINKKQRTVTLRHQAIELTSKEFDLLSFFASNPETAFSRSELLDKVWGYHHQGYEHTVNSHINRLRGKLEKASDDQQYIHTVWGVGYRFHAPDMIGHVS